MKSKQTPIYTHCNYCLKQYDMVKWGVRCPSCKGRKDKRSGSRE